MTAQNSGQPPSRSTRIQGSRKATSTSKMTKSMAIRKNRIEMRLRERSSSGSPDS